MIALVAVAAALLVATGAVAALLIAGGGGNDEAASESGKGYLGLTVTANPPQGLRVAAVEADGPAARAGIQAGDYLRSIDGQLVRTPEQLRNAVESKTPGTQVSLTYERGDKELQASVKLGEAPANAQIEATPAPQGQNQGPNRGLAPNAANRGQLGVQVQNVTPQLKQRFNLTRDNGVVIVSVLPNSVAATAGLKAGDIVASINGRSITTAEQLTDAITASAGGQVSLEIVRGSEQLTVQVNLGSAQLFPGFENLPPALQQRLRELAQSGNVTLEQLQRLALGQNNIALGTVKSISETSLTVTRLDGNLQPGGDVTFTLNDRTQYRLGNDSVSSSEIKTGSMVMVISLDGESAIGVFLYQR